MAVRWGTKEEKRKIIKKDVRKAIVMGIAGLSKNAICEGWREIRCMNLLPN
jgi:hypothetical protein